MKVSKDSEKEAIDKRSPKSIEGADLRPAGCFRQFLVDLHGLHYTGITYEPKLRLVLNEWSNSQLRCENASQTKVLAGDRPWDDSFRRLKGSVNSLLCPDRTQREWPKPIVRL